MRGMYLDVTTFFDHEAEQLARRRCAQDRRVILLLEDARLVSDDDTVAVHLFLHVGCVAGAVDRQ